MVTRKFIYLLTISTIILIAGCLKIDADADEKRVSLFFEVNGLDQNIESDTNSDSLSIDEFKFAINQFNLYAEGNLTLESTDEITAFIFGARSSGLDQVLVIDVGLGFSDVNNFNGYEMFLTPIEERGNILDNDFFGEDTNYSIIIKGLYNGQNFIYRSSVSFNKRFDINNVRLTPTAETIVIINSVDVEDVFRNEDGSLLDPDDPDNTGSIVDNFREALRIQSYASNQL